MATNQTQALPAPATLPATGKSRFSNFKAFCPFSREKFRQLALEGKAPKPERMGIRCTYYDNAELHRFLADPLNYRVACKHEQQKL
jgi:hypothetical protein